MNASSIRALMPLVPAAPLDSAGPRKLVTRISKMLSNLSTDPAQLQALDKYYYGSHNIRFSRSQFPSLPLPSAPVHVVDRFVENVTSIHYRNDTTRQALQELMESRHISRESFDLILGWFAKRGEPISILELLKSWQSTHQSHFNHWIYSLYVQRRYTNDFRLTGMVPILAAMRDESHVANAQTWNNSLLVMPTHYGMRSIYNEMVERNIPFSKEASFRLVKYLGTTLGVETVTARVMQDSMADLGTVNALVAMTLRNKKPNNQNVLEAFDFLELWASNGGVPTASTMNVFLEHFADRGHLDWQIGLAAYFEVEYGLQLTSRSFEHLLRATWHLNECPQKYQVAGMIIKESLKVALTNHSRSNIRILAGMAEKNRYEIDYPGQHVWQYLRRSLNWSKFGGPPDYSQESAAAAASVIGVGSARPGVKIRPTSMADAGVNMESLLAEAP